MIRALYGLKCVGSAWAAAIRKFMSDIGFQPCMDDADVWIRSYVYTYDIESGDVSLNISSKNLTAGERYWEYVLIHVENFLVAYRQD